MFSYLNKVFGELFSIQNSDEKKPSPTQVKTTVKHYHFVSMGETLVQESSLPPAEKKVSNKVIPLEEIPFEATRNELIQIYLSVIQKNVQEDKVKDIPLQLLITHYLFLKSLAATALSEHQQLLNSLVKSLGEYLAQNEPETWNLTEEYIKNSEFPIIRWLKYHQEQFNFILNLVVEQYKNELTYNQKALIQKFPESPAFFFPNPIYIAWLAQSYEADSKLNPMYQDSMATHYYHAQMTDNLLLRTQLKQVHFAPEHHYQKEKKEIKTSFRFNLDNGKLLRIQGRTLLFSTDNDEVIAVKVQKKGESRSVFIDEFQMADYLSKHQQRLNLQSELPVPLGQYSLKRTELLAKCSKSPDYDLLKSLIADTEKLDVYVYKAPPAYFTYLHDEKKNLSEFAAAVKKNVHDLFVLLREGIVFPQLADLFHTHIHEENREDRGRYRALVQLLSIFQFELGRIDKWQKAVEFVNLRDSGIADLGDSIPLSSLLTVSDITNRYYFELLTGAYHQTFFDKTTNSARSLFNNKRRLFGNYLYLNIMAEYLLVIQLTLGSYGTKATRAMDTEQKEIVWQELAKLMFECCADTITLMTGIPKSRAHVFLKQRANMEKHYQQTHFWMTPDYANLDPDSIQFQQHIMYPGEAGYEFTDELVPDVGLSQDGINQDLGGYNQAIPLKELEKLLYATVTLIEGTQQLDKQFFQQLAQTEKVIDQDAGVEICHHEVAKLLDLTRPGCFFQRRLALSYYETIKLKYPSVTSTDSRFETIAKQDAALKIVQFWQTHKKTEVSDEEKSKTSIKKQ